MRPYYQRAGITLYLGDCREVLPRLTGEVDLLLTDPPYGVDASTTGMRRKQLALASLANDLPADRGLVLEGLALAWPRLAMDRHAYVFGPFDLAVLPQAGGIAELVWDKGGGFVGDTQSPWGKSHEAVQFAVRSSGTKGSRGGQLARIRRGSVLRHQRPSGRAVLHPTEKPVTLLRELVEISSRHGELVLDPFVGSGSTLVAALLEGRRAIGIELDQAWCDVAVARLDALTKQASLFGET